MGGSGSGRLYGGGLTVEDCLTLDINKLARDRIVDAGTHSGTLTWAKCATGETVGSMGYEVHVDGPHIVRLRFYWGQPHFDETVWLETTRPYFGGVRWWFTCPRCAGRAAKLHLPPGDKRFLCRRCWGLSYESQRESPMFRALTQAQKIRLRLGGSTDTTAPFPERPKGMHRRTYQRLRDQGERYERASWSLAESRYGLPLGCI